jgi:RNA polymerase sigma-70 factor (ECF subfamily)
MPLSLAHDWDLSAVADVSQPSSMPLSFDDFFRVNHHRLFAALCLTTGDRHEAEEIAQDAFVRILERWSHVAALEDPVGYLYVTAMNVFRRRYRRAKLVGALPLGRGEPSQDAFEVVDARDALIRVLRDLSPRQRAAIVLTTILDLPSEEAARILRIKDSTVRVLAKRARDEMRSRLGDDR